jgi:hypothetical protein
VVEPLTANGATRRRGSRRRSCRRGSFLVSTRMGTGKGRHSEDRCRPRPPRRTSHRSHSHSHP